jgi:hypothetical protein
VILAWGAQRVPLAFVAGLRMSSAEEGLVTLPTKEHDQRQHLKF